MALRKYLSHSVNISNIFYSFKMGLQYLYKYIIPGLSFLIPYKHKQLKAS